MTPRAHPLRNSYWKAERAKVHLDDLRAAVLRFVASDPYTVVSNENTEGSGTRYRITFEHPDVNLFLIAGDVFQCLRSALDQAVWSLANISHPDPDWTQFPIFEIDNSANRKTFVRYTKGVPPKAIDVLESLQPYHRPTGIPIGANLLWQLHEMNRIDKHRRIPVRTMGTIIDEVDADDVTPTEYGCEVVRTGPDQGLTPRCSPCVVFGERNRGITIYFDGIEQIYHFITDNVLPRLAGCV